MALYQQAMGDRNEQGRYISSSFSLPRGTDPPSNPAEKSCSQISQLLREPPGLLRTPEVAVSLVTPCITCLPRRLMAFASTPCFPHSHCSGLAPPNKSSVLQSLCKPLLRYNPDAGGHSSPWLRRWVHSTSTLVRIVIAK